MQNFENLLREYQEKGILFKPLNLIKTGKEAEVYRVKSNETFYALKIYKDYNLRSFQDNQEYLAGKFIKKHSLRRAVRKKTKLGKDFIHDRWIQREFGMLTRLYKLGCSIPQPVEQAGNSILMEYLGKEDMPAPSLKNVSLSVEQADTAFKTILSTIETFLHAGIVHADLSEFNILWWKEKPYVIDFPQSVNIKENPNAGKLLERDIQNVCKYFSKYIDINQLEVENHLNDILQKYTLYGG